MKHNMKRLSLHLLLFICLGSNYSAFSQPDFYKHWQAKWITNNWPPAVENNWTCFVKEINIDNPTDSIVTAHIAVDSKYWLWINEELVVFEGGLKRGPTPDDTYFDEINIAPFLHKGNNTIAALVWFWGRDGFCHKNSGQMGFLFDAQAKNFSILSDSTWKSMIHPAFGNTSDPIPNFRLPEYNIKFYADLDIAEWYKPGTALQWPVAKVVGKAGCQPWNNLWRRPFPQWENSGLVAYENHLDFPFVSDGNAIRMKLPKNYSITPYLKIDGDKNVLIDVRTDNYKGGSENNLRTEYVTRNGIQEFETYGYMNGHEVIYSIPKGIKILDLKYRRTSFPAKPIGEFKSDNDELNILWEKSLNTMDINMRDAIQDPDRERSQWWGDVVILLGQILCTCDTNGHHAITKAISNLVEWQRPDSTLYSPVPSGEWHGELPTQMLASIGKYGFWRYFSYTGDTAEIRYVYPHVKKYMALWKIGDDGLVVHRSGGWNWYDWGKDIDEKVIENGWYYLALQSAYNMAMLLGNEADATSYAKLMVTIRQSFNKQFWNGTCYRSANYTGQTDDRAQGLAVVAGLADRIKYEPLKKVFQKEFHAGPYLEKYILEALFIMNAPEMAMQRMKYRYSKMISSNVTTLWEGWDIGSAEYGGGSYNHGWAGGPLTLMHEYIAGIAPTEAGYKTFSVMPQMGDLKSVHCITPTVKGNIILDLKRNNKTLSVKIQVPPNTTGTVGIPKIGMDIKRIYANGKLVFSKTNGAKNSSEVKYKGEDGNYYIFDMQEGKWLFTAE